MQRGIVEVLVVGSHLEVLLVEDELGTIGLVLGRQLHTLLAQVLGQRARSTQEHSHLCVCSSSIIERVSTTKAASSSSPRSSFVLVAGWLSRTLVKILSQSGRP